MSTRKMFLWRNKFLLKKSALTGAMLVKGDKPLLSCIHLSMLQVMVLF